MQTQATELPEKTRVHWDGNDWRANTEVHLDATRVLMIKTNRVLSTGPLVSAASVWHVTNSGFGLSHAFGLGVPGKGDFHEYLLRAHVAQLTEKVVEGQHRRALADLASIKARALAFYATPGATQALADQLEARHVPG
jgi:hypothetical protein